MNSKDLYIYNSLTSSKEKFKPLKNNRVGMYVCGHVYSEVHLGNCGHSFHLMSYSDISHFLVIMLICKKHCELDILKIGRG